MPPPKAVVPLARLALTVQLVSDRTLFSQSIPPPRAVPKEMTKLLLMTESVIVVLPPVVLMPPPADVAWLLLMVLEATFSVPWLEMPPTTTAELPLTVQLVSVVVLGPNWNLPPRLDTPPPLVLEELPLTVQFVSVAV